MNKNIHIKTPGDSSARRRQSSPGCMIIWLSAQRHTPGVTLWGARRIRHGSTRNFHSYLYIQLQKDRKGGTQPAPCGKAFTCSFLSVRRYPAGLFLTGACPVRGRPAPYACLCLLLYSDLGFMTSRQSKSPRSRAMISTSAVAILVATGILYISHIRNSSCSVSS